MADCRSFQSTDLDLVRRLRTGDDEAVADLAREHGPRIQQLAFRYLRNVEDAEELTQDVLLKTVEKIADFRGDSALSSWLYRVTFNAAMSRLRHLRTVRETEAPDAAVLTPLCRPHNQPLEVPDWSEMADEIALRSQMRRRLKVAIRSLPVIYRAPVILRDFRGLSTGEASTALQLNDQTLKSRLHRGRLMLRRELSDFANGLALHRVAS